MVRALRRLLVLTTGLVALVTGVPGAEARLDAIRGRLAADPGAPGVQTLYRELAVDALVTRRLPEGLETLKAVFARALKSRKDVPSDGERAVLLRAADAFALMTYAQAASPDLAVRRDVATWLFGDEGRVRTFLDTISPEDDWPAAYGIIADLFAHDPRGRDEYRRLILALALVWDQPRPRPHPQMGRGQLPFDEPITARYDDFHDLFASRRAEIPYEKLSVSALLHVVDTPVPLSELRWVRREVRPSNWDRKVFEIRYDEARLERGEYEWPYGPYALAAMKERGGICTDQAYYATLCARAYGVPALLFVGEGRRGGHAWYGYMKGTDRWVMDIGRYAYDRFATGYALNPQTNQPLSDHDVSFLCDRALREETFSAAARLTRLALVLRRLGYPVAARDAAERSIAISPLYEAPWTVQEGILEEARDWGDLAALLSRKAEAFRRVPDYAARIAARRADVLRTLGDEAAADRLLARQVRDVSRNRDDLERALVSSQVRAAYEKGDYDGARRQMEDLLKDQKDEGQKLAALLDAYLELTRETKQTAEAVRFLKRYTESLDRRSRGSDWERAALMRILLQAYKNNGDEDDAARLQRRLGRLER